jgi:DNA-binding CsgD family transcriptional regulator
MLRSAALLATDPDETDSLFAAAIATHPTEVPFDLARTHLRWGEHQRRRRAITTSRTHLHQAWQTFHRLGARPWADRAAAELRAAGGTSTPTRSLDLDSLRPQELHCATLAADGMSNRDLGAAMFISAKTVEYHLRKVYTKLGITSRAQLGRALGDIDRARIGSG